MNRVRLVPNLTTGRVTSGVFFARPLTDATQIRIAGDAIPRATWCSTRCTRRRSASPRMPFEFTASTTCSAWSPDHPNLYRIRLELIRGGEVKDEIARPFRLPHHRDPQRQVLPQRRAALPALGPRPGLLPGHDLHRAVGGVPGGSVPQGEGARPQLPALPHQGGRSALLRGGGPDGHADLDGAAQRRHGDRPLARAQGEAPEGHRRPRRATIRRSSSGRSSTRTGASTSSTTRTTATGSSAPSRGSRPTIRRASWSTTRRSRRASTWNPTSRIITSMPPIPITGRSGTSSWTNCPSRASWLYSPHGDAVITGREPLMCSEFGNWGLPYPKDLRDEKGEEPWWFETGHDWGEGVMYAHGVENRFSDWSLDRVFGDLRRFVIAAQWQQFRALKYEIEVDAPQAEPRRLRHHRAARLPLGIERPARHAPQSARVPRALPHRQLGHGDRAEMGARLLLGRRDGGAAALPRPWRRAGARGLQARGHARRREPGYRPAPHRGAGRARSRPHRVADARRWTSPPCGASASICARPDGTPDRA